MHLGRKFTGWLGRKSQLCFARSLSPRWLGLVAVAPASSETVPLPDRQLLVSKYHFEESGLEVDVDLNADGTARY